MDDITCTHADRDLILAGLFELTVARLDNDDLYRRVRDLAVKLGGDPDALFYGGDVGN